MKKTMLMSLLAIMVMAWACDKGGGSEEVAPAEIPRKEVEIPVYTKIPWDTVKVDIKIPDCIGDSIVIPHAKIDVLVMDSAFTPPKIIASGYCMIGQASAGGSCPSEKSYKPIGNFFINSQEEYEKLVKCAGDYRVIDFNKYSLLATIVVFPYNLSKEQEVIKNCKTGTYHFNTISRDENLPSTGAVTCAYYFAVIPKISNQTLIQFNHQHIKRK